MPRKTVPASFVYIPALRERGFDEAVIILLMNPELLEEADRLWEQSDKAVKFQGRFDTYPFRRGIQLVDHFYKLGESIKVSDNINTSEEVLTTELKRRLYGEAVYLDHHLSGRFYTFNEVLDLYGIDKEDTEGLKSWLSDNRNEVLDTIDRVFDGAEVDDFRIDLPVDIPLQQDQAKALADIHIGNYHRKLGALFNELTAVGTFLRDINAVPTFQSRSYFNPYTRTLALGIPAICYITPDNTIHIRERELLRLFGHEGMGHGLQKVVTDSSNLPAFLKRISESTRATTESVGQFYEKVIFDDLANAPKTLKDLGINHIFSEIYQEEKDSQLIVSYQRRLFHYAITVLADKNLGSLDNPETRSTAIRNRQDLLSEVALYPGYAIWFIERSRNNFDSEGNLSFDLAREIVYAAQPVEKVLEVMAEKKVEYNVSGRSIIDKLLLTGYWTPIGLVENAKIA